MRLGTCIAGELAAGIALATGAFFAGSWGLERAREWAGGEAQAASLTATTAEVDWQPIELVSPIGAIEPHRIQVAEPVASDRALNFSGSGTFFGVPDEELLAPIDGEAIQRVKFNRGGSGVSLRIDYAGGGRASFKPDQINLQSEPRHEIAAYRIDRLLGIGHVAPVLPVRYRMDDIINHLDGRFSNSIGRITGETYTSDGWVNGSAAWWIPVIAHARIAGADIDSYGGKVAWKRMLTVGVEIPEGDREMAEQISTMVLFDHLINNMDRWTGNNTRSSPDNKQLYFMDNALAFGGKSIGGDVVIVYMKRCQKFSRSLVQKIRALRVENVQRAVQSAIGPYPRLLDDHEIEALMKRRDYQMSYIDELIAAYGEDKVLVFP